MHARATRIELTRLLEDSGVTSLRDSGQVPAFIDGSADTLLASLDMDSLAAMEVCIALELHYGLAIVPSTLLGVGTLGDLAELIMNERR